MRNKKKARPDSIAPHLDHRLVARPLVLWFWWERKMPRSQGVTVTPVIKIQRGKLLKATGAL
jgi:hypothetical protein